MLKEKSKDYPVNRPGGERRHPAGSQHPGDGRFQADPGWWLMGIGFLWVKA